MASFAVGDGKRSHDNENDRKENEVHREHSSTHSVSSFPLFACWVFFLFGRLFDDTDSRYSLLLLDPCIGWNRVLVEKRVRSQPGNETEVVDRPRLGKSNRGKCWLWNGSNQCCKGIQKQKQFGKGPVRENARRARKNCRGHLWLARHTPNNDIVFIK